MIDLFIFAIPIIFFAACITYELVRKTSNGYKNKAIYLSTFSLIFLIYIISSSATFL